MPVPLSVLDLSPVLAGVRPSQSLHLTLDLAELADRLGYHRYWVAEHHGIPSVTGTAPEVLIGHVAMRTRRLRVGSGGIMLPNHSPLRVAEAFRVLAALHPGRIDLGVGRAPGGSAATALALRRTRERLHADDFPELLDELAGYAEGFDSPQHPFAALAAMPTDVPLPPVWILGSTVDGAGLAAARGLGFACAHHINPAGARDAARRYRDEFQPSGHLARPRLILALSVVCAETEAEARRLAATFELAWVRLRTGRPAPLAPAETARAYPYTPAERLAVEAARHHFLCGDPDQVREQIEDWTAATGADEVMVTTMVYDHQARRRSYELLAAAVLPAADDAARRPEPALAAPAALTP